MPYTLKDLSKALQRHFQWRLHAPSIQAFDVDDFLHSPDTLKALTLPSEEGKGEAVDGDALKLRPDVVKSPVFSKLVEETNYYAVYSRDDITTLTYTALNWILSAGDDEHQTLMKTLLFSVPKVSELVASAIALKSFGINISSIVKTNYKYFLQKDRYYAPGSALYYHQGLSFLAEIYAHVKILGNDHAGALDDLIKLHNKEMDKLEPLLQHEDNEIAEAAQALFHYLHANLAFYQGLVELDAAIKALHESGQMQALYLTPEPITLDEFTAALERLLHQAGVSFAFNLSKDARRDFNQFHHPFTSRKDYFAAFLAEKHKLESLLIGLEDREARRNLKQLIMAFPEHDKQVYTTSSSQGALGAIVPPARVREVDGILKPEAIAPYPDGDILSMALRQTIKALMPDEHSKKSKYEVLARTSALAQAEYIAPRSPKSALAQFAFPLVEGYEDQHKQALVLRQRELASKKKVEKKKALRTLQTFLSTGTVDDDSKVLLEAADPSWLIRTIKSLVAANAQKARPDFTMYPNKWLKVSRTITAHCPAFRFIPFEQVTSLNYDTLAQLQQRPILEPALRDNAHKVAMNTFYSSKMSKRINEAIVCSYTRAEKQVALSLFERALNTPCEQYAKIVNEVYPGAINHHARALFISLNLLVHQQAATRLYEIIFDTASTDRAQLQRLKQIASDIVCQKLAQQIQAARQLNIVPAPQMDLFTDRYEDEQKAAYGESAPPIRKRASQ